MPPRIDLPDAPAIPGLIFRRWRGKEDYLAMGKVMRDAGRADGDERSFDASYFSAFYITDASFDPRTDVALAEVNGEVIGFCRGMWEVESSTDLTLFVHLGYLQPQWRRKKIGTAMFNYIRQHLAQKADQHTPPWAYQTFVWDAEIGNKRLVESAGYRLDTSMALMLRPNLENIPDAPLPEGIEVRPVSETQFSAIYEAEIEAFAGHWGGAPSHSYQEWLNAAAGVDPSLWRVAWSGDQIVGMVRGFINDAENATYQRKRGWTEYISVRQPWRGKGVARSLIAQTFRALKERGMAETALNVHTDNKTGAFHLYESMGFRKVRTRLIYRMPF